MPHARHHEQAQELAQALATVTRLECAVVLDGPAHRYELVVGAVVHDGLAAVGAEVRELQVDGVEQLARTTQLGLVLLGHEVGRVVALLAHDLLGDGLTGRCRMEAVGGTRRAREYVELHERRVVVAQRLAQGQRVAGVGGEVVVLEEGVAQGAREPFDHAHLGGIENGGEPLAQDPLPLCRRLVVADDAVFDAIGGIRHSQDLTIDRSPGLSVDKALCAGLLLCADDGQAKEQLAHPEVGGVAADDAVVVVSIALRCDQGLAAPLGRAREVAVLGVAPIGGTHDGEDRVMGLLDGGMGEVLEHLVVEGEVSRALGKGVVRVERRSLMARVAAVDHVAPLDRDGNPVPHLLADTRTAEEGNRTVEAAPAHVQHAAVPRALRHQHAEADGVGRGVEAEDAPVDPPVATVLLACLDRVYDHAPGGQADNIGGKAGGDGGDVCDERGHGEPPAETESYGSILPRDTRTRYSARRRNAPVSVVPCGRTLTALGHAAPGSLLFT